MNQISICPYRIVTTNKFPKVMIKSSKLSECFFYECAFPWFCLYIPGVPENAGHMTIIPPKGQIYNFSAWKGVWSCFKDAELPKTEKGAKCTKKWLKNTFVSIKFQRKISCQVQLLCNALDADVFRRCRKNTQFF